MANEVAMVEENWLLNEGSVVQELVHCYNLYNLCGKRMLGDLINQLIKCGWGQDKISKMQAEAARLSNWGKNTYIRDEVHSNNGKVHEINHII